MHKQKTNNMENGFTYLVRVTYRYDSQETKSYNFVHLSYGAALDEYRAQIADSCKFISILMGSNNASFQLVRQVNGKTDQVLMALNATSFDFKHRDNEN